MLQDRPLISTVFITYNRLETLVPAISTFRRNTVAEDLNLELLISDDGSPEHIRLKYQGLPVDRVCSSAQNRGLGANQNQGLRNSRGDLILQLQDDWICNGPPDYLEFAVRVLRQRPEIGLLVLVNHPHDLPIRELVHFEDRVVRIYQHRPELPIEQVGQNAYSDWPHLKRSDFHEVVGYYQEGVRMERCELDMARKFNRQSTYFIADVIDLKAFRHVGAELSYRQPRLIDKANKLLNELPVAGRVWRAAKRGAKTVMYRLGGS